MSTTTAQLAPADGAAVSFGEAWRTWLKIGMLGFGGPAGQIALMHRILVDEKRWVSEGRFLHALNYCMPLPGPEAQQLATYIGWLLHRTLGGVVAGTLFVLPGFVVIVTLSTIYALFQGTPALETLFFGLKAAVLAVVVEAVLRVGTRALKNRAMVALAAVAFVAIYALGVPFPLIVLGAGLIGLVGAKLRPDLFAPSTHGSTTAPDTALERQMAHSEPSLAHVARVILIWGALWAALPLLLMALFGAASIYATIALFFSKMAVVTFGGAYAVLAYVAQQAVETLGWLKPGEMLDGLAMAETTPGPLILVLTYVGFLASFRAATGLDPLLAALLGAVLTTWVTFIPCFLWIFLGAPYIEALRGNRLLGGALSAITAAVVGVILNLAVWFALHTLFGEVHVRALGPLSPSVPVFGTLDPWAALLALGAIMAMFRFKVGILPTLAGCAVAGAVIRMAVRSPGWVGMLPLTTLR
jgi:chromate transporter